MALLVLLHSSQSNRLLKRVHLYAETWYCGLQYASEP